MKKQVLAMLVITTIICIISNRAVAGTPTSASALVTPGNTGVIYTVPIGTNFILKQVCASDWADFLSTTFPYIGRIQNVQFGNDACVNFKPGVAIPGGDDISCQVLAGAGSNCLINGVQQ